MKFGKKTPRKEWTDFGELQDLLDNLKMNDTDFMRVGGCSSTTFYRWRNKGKVPAVMLSTIKEQIAKYFYNQYKEKMKIIWGDDEKLPTYLL